MRSAPLLLLATLSLSSTGCAAAFRNGKPDVRFESAPAGATAQVNNGASTPTPGQMPIPRAGTSSITVTKEGYATHRGLVKKSLNPGWLTVDILTCVFPVALCIPLLVDAVTGAWLDVPDAYTAKLDPAAPSAAPTASTGPAPTPTASSPASGVAAIPLTAPPASLSDSERKSAARAAFQEGVQLQDKGDHEGALSRFQTAQKLFDAPTHILRIGQTLASMGKLLEAAEVYEVLTRRELAAGAPEAFRDAQATGAKELEKVRPRIPTVRVQITPPPAQLKDLVVTLNGVTMPNELIGIARPVNPGTYKVTVFAKDYAPTKPVEVEMKEGASRTVDLKLTK